MTTTIHDANVIIYVLNSFLFLSLELIKMDEKIKKMSWIFNQLKRDLSEFQKKSNSHLAIFFETLPTISCYVTFNLRLEISNE